MRERTKKTMDDYSTNCQKTRKVYLPTDKKKYSAFVPSVYCPVDISLSKAEIIHGSNSNKDGRAETERWVVNTWFVAIQPDHETLDMPECDTWSALSAAH